MNLPKNTKRSCIKPIGSVIICANANMAYTTDSGVKIVPIGCLRD